MLIFFCVHMKHKRYMIVVRFCTYTHSSSHGQQERRQENREESENRTINKQMAKEESEAARKSEREKKASATVITLWKKK